MYSASDRAILLELPPRSVVTRAPHGGAVQQLNECVTHQQSGLITCVLAQSHAAAAAAVRAAGDTAPARRSHITHHPHTHIRHSTAQQTGRR